MFKNSETELFKQPNYLLGKRFRKVVTKDNQKTQVQVIK